MSEKYRTIYQVEYKGPDGIPRDEIPEGWGACDSMVMISITGQIGGPGPLSMAILSGNGYAEKQTELEPWQKFEVWALFAHHLAEHLPPGAKRDLCHLITDIIRQGVTGERIEPPYFESPFL